MYQSTRDSFLKSNVYLCAGTSLGSSEQRSPDSSNDLAAYSPQGERPQSHSALQLPSPGAPSGDGW